MINAIHFPVSLTGKELDDYLSRGWFRMGQAIFTTDAFPFNGHIHTVHWLRFVVHQVNYGRSQKKLIALNKSFRAEVAPLNLTTELEELFSLYKNSVDFAAPESVTEYMFDGRNFNVYNTKMITLMDKGKLIAAGLFDEGEKSIAGILNFYHPDYKRKSLGKYLMLLKINYAIQNGIKWYYPGYVASGYPKFDYKLFPDTNAAEVFEPYSNEWVPVRLFHWPDHSPGFHPMYDSRGESKG